MFCCCCCCCCCCWKGEPLSKIDFDDSDEQIRMKIEGGTIALIKYVMIHKREGDEIHLNPGHVDFVFVFV
jgi:hypothetical protein